MSYYRRRGPHPTASSVLRELSKEEIFPAAYREALAKAAIKLSLQSK